MSIEQLEFYLDRGDSMGFVKETDAVDFIGWISLRKRKANLKHLELFADTPWVYDKARHAQQYPYVLELCELSRAAYNSDDAFPEESDYRMADVHYFSTLAGTQEYLLKWNKKLEDIKWLCEIPSLE